MSHSYWKDKKVLVAGGGGFVGSHLVEQLVRFDSAVRVPTRSMDRAKCNLYDLLNKIELVHADLSKLDDCRKVVRGVDVVFNLAAEVGGIGHNVNSHGAYFTINATLNLMLLEASRIENVEKYQCTSSTCVYSREKSLNAKEADGFVDDPEPTVLGYGWAKRVAELQARFYAKEYGMKISILRPTNAYGQRDDFSVETSHVIPALVRRVFESRNSITVWGSGSQTRSFIYVEDLARGMMEVTEKYPLADPINLGTEEEITIANLVRLIMRICGKNLQVNFDTSKPEGQRRKFADISKAREKIGWYRKFSLEDGLTKTISWYRERLP